MSLSSVHQSDDTAVSFQHCVYLHTLRLDSFLPQALHHKYRGSRYQMVKQTHRPTAHNSNPLSSLLSTCLSLVRCLSHLRCTQRGGERKEGGRNIMRISKKFLGGVFNFNHQAYPSSEALISLRSLLCPGGRMASTWSSSTCKGHRGRIQM